MPDGEMNVLQCSATKKAASHVHAGRMGPKKAWQQIEADTGMTVEVDHVIISTMTSIQPHIEQAEDGTLYVAGTPYKVKMLILEHVAWGLNAIEIREGHPGLTLGDVHAVLTYFYDNEQAARQELETEAAKLDELRHQSKPQTTREELLSRPREAESGSAHT